MNMLHAMVTFHGLRDATVQILEKEGEAWPFNFPRREASRIIFATLSSTFLVFK